MDKEQKVRLTPSNGFLRERPTDLWIILYSNRLINVPRYISVHVFYSNVDSSQSAKYHTSRDVL